jgi:hypothetical protein
MMKFALMAVGLTLVGLIAVPTGHSFAYTGENLATGAKISIGDARAIALKARGNDHRRGIGEGEGR